MQRASDIMRSKSPLAPPHTPASLRTTPPPPSPPPVSRSPEVYTTAPQSPAPYIEEVRSKILQKFNRMHLNRLSVCMCFCRQLGLQIETTVHVSFAEDFN